MPTALGVASDALLMPTAFGVLVNFEKHTILARDDIMTFMHFMEF